MTTKPTRLRDWRDLPFAQIWNVDTEFYPGPGLANGGREGDLITPLCLSAIEMRSGRTIRLWQDELGPFPPYRLDQDALFTCFVATAEFGFHQSLSWGKPARAIDIYTEFRHLTNDARVKSSGPTKREKGFYSLAGALRYFDEDELDTGHKKDMRDRILKGPPFTSLDRDEIQLYNFDDTDALRRLAQHVLSCIASLPHAYHRADYGWALAKQERRGVPVNLPDFARLNDRWNDIRVDLVKTVDKRYGCYEIVGGVPHFRDHLLLEYAHRQGINWPKLKDDPDKPDKRSETFRNLAMAYPQIGDLHELRAALAQLRKSGLSVGSDARNRAPLWLFGTKTGRNAPESGKFIFGPSKFLRFLIEPAPGMGLVYRDFAQQEIRIAAVRSRDAALLAACESGDVYIGVAVQLGFDPLKPGTRDLFKVVLLSVNYGGGPGMLAALAGIPLYEAKEIVSRLKSRFSRFCAWCEENADFAGLNLYLTNELGWTVQCPPGSPPRTIRNWPVQSCGSAGAIAEFW
jgi:DNA polymerase I